MYRINANVVKKRKNVEMSPKRTVSANIAKRNNAKMLSAKLVESQRKRRQEEK